MILPNDINRQEPLEILHSQIIEHTSIDMRPLEDIANYLRGRVPVTAEIRQALRSEAIRSGMSKREVDKQLAAYLPKLSGIMPGLGRLLMVYLNIRTKCMDDVEFDLNYALFRTLYFWNHEMSIDVRSAIFRFLGCIHLRVINDLNTSFRPEFSFLSYWSGGLDWAMPFSDLYNRCEHGRIELAELVTQFADEDQRLGIFFGIDHDTDNPRCEWESWSGPMHDVTSRCLGFTHEDIAHIEHRTRRNILAGLSKFAGE